MVAMMICCPVSLGVMVISAVICSVYSCRIITNDGQIFALDSRGGVTHMVKIGNCGVFVCDIRYGCHHFWPVVFWRTVVFVEGGDSIGLEGQVIEGMIQNVDFVCGIHQYTFAVEFPIILLSLGNCIEDRIGLNILNRLITRISFIGFVMTVLSQSHSQTHQQNKTQQSYYLFARHWVYKIYQYNSNRAVLFAVNNTIIKVETFQEECITMEDITTCIPSPIITTQSNINLDAAPLNHANYRHFIDIEFIYDQAQVTSKVLGVTEIVTTKVFSPDSLGVKVYSTVRVLFDASSNNLVTLKAERSQVRFEESGLSVMNLLLALKI